MFDTFSDRGPKWALIDSKSKGSLGFGFILESPGDSSLFSSVIWSTQVLTKVSV